MVKILTASLILLLSGISTSFATQQADEPAHGRFGIGVMVGHPTGISGKLWMGSSNALHGGAAWELGTGSSDFHLHVDYARYNHDMIEGQEGLLSFYYGIGGRILMRGSNDYLGVRFPLGLNYQFGNTPLELFVEAAPILDIAPGTDVRVNSALGLRLYFN